MIQIKAKVYYEILTGKVLVVTSEMECSMEARTKEQDMETYSELKDRNIDEIDFIELPYGSRASVFTDIKSYSVDVNAKTFIPVYYTKDELEAQKLLEQKNEGQISSDRINDISTYANLDTTSIAELENYLLLREKNKILGGI